jgi:cardiolipin synthase
MWDLVRGETTDYSRFCPETPTGEGEGGGFVQPFTDTPLDDEPVGATVYKQIIQRSRKYVYINSPYLIIDDEMISALTTAAACGVDVRLVTPAVCDSRLVQEMSRSYYEVLVSAGVKVYEYTPGMVHAKTFVSDDRWAVVGSINLDYRSLFLHHECAVWMSGTPAVMDMKAAFEEELTKCKPWTAELCREQSKYRHVLWALLRALAPLF